jgi:DMSO/TMAO reductase YedYZ molybdopterin-dependent catalytic subunit
VYTKFICFLILLSVILVTVTISCSQAVTPSPQGEVEATEFQRVDLKPIVQQQNNALAGTQYIDKSTYRLIVDGLVDKPLSLSYDDLLAYPEISRVMDLQCVDGWDFIAKWTGPELTVILQDAGIKPAARIVIFHTADFPSGYTSLDLCYIEENRTLLAMKDNDISLSPERGFPFQVVARNKFGYKWAKWVIRIELSDDTNFRGYWESRHYNNNADVGGPRYDLDQ